MEVCLQADSQQVNISHETGFMTEGCSLGNTGMYKYANLCGKGNSEAYCKYLFFYYVSQILESNAFANIFLTDSPQALRAYFLALINIVCHFVRDRRRQKL